MSADSIEKIIAEMRDWSQTSEHLSVKGWAAVFADRLAALPAPSSEAVDSFGRNLLVQNLASIVARLVRDVRALADSDVKVEAVRLARANKAMNFLRQSGIDISPLRDSIADSVPAVAAEPRAPQAPSLDRECLKMKVTEEMVNRFLSWKMPESFGPDCYVMFHREKAKRANQWPVGTNILTAPEARAMLEHVLETVAQQPGIDVEGMRKDADRGKWQDIGTLPDCDDELWFAIGDSIEGPRAPQVDDADRWQWWCYAVPPPLPISARSAKESGS